MNDFITLAHGSGGKEMDTLIKSYGFGSRGEWEDFDDDAASYRLELKNLVFTTDSFVVDPIFFPGGDIGHLAFSGTVNDLLVMGATPIGLSLSLIIEEGFPIKDLQKILGSIKSLSEKFSVPIVTGDTKVMEKGKIDKIAINTSGVGLALKILKERVVPGDKVILSGSLGEHAVALLSRRFDYETDIITDSKPLIEEFESVRKSIKVAKDPTRGGISSCLNEICSRSNVGMLIDEESIPARKEVLKVVEMLGINLYDLASEGRFVCVASKESADKVVRSLREFNEVAQIIGEITDDDKVVIQTVLGKRILPRPSGRIVPRIC